MGEQGNDLRGPNSCGPIQRVEGLQGGQALLGPLHVGQADHLVNQRLGILRSRGGNRNDGGPLHAVAGSGGDGSGTGRQGRNLAVAVDRSHTAVAGGPGHRLIGGITGGNHCGSDGRILHGQGRLRNLDCHLGYRLLTGRHRDGQRALHAVGGRGGNGGGTGRQRRNLAAAADRGHLAVAGAPGHRLIGGVAGGHSSGCGGGTVDRQRILGNAHRHLGHRLFTGCCRPPHKHLHPVAAVLAPRCVAHADVGVVLIQDVGPVPGGIHPLLHRSRSCGVAGGDIFTVGISALAGPGLVQGGKAGAAVRTGVGEQGNNLRGPDGCGLIQRIKGLQGGQALLGPLHIGQTDADRHLCHRLRDRSLGGIQLCPLHQIGKLAQNDGNFRPGNAVAAVKAVAVVAGKRAGPVPLVNGAAIVAALGQVRDVAVRQGVDCLHLVIGDRLVQNGNHLIPGGVPVDGRQGNLVRRKDAVVQAVLVVGHVPGPGSLGQAFVVIPAVHLIGQHRSLGQGQVSVGGKGTVPHSVHHARIHNFIRKGLEPLALTYIGKALGRQRSRSQPCGKGQRAERGHQLSCKTMGFHSNHPSFRKISSWLRDL